ncbi:MAG TPA: proteasome subunit beta [Candidatus Woesearchaeota archaeon]|nr:proteasome subunit beta [Candidatus Woesearchaeota archaeon]
MENEIMKTGTTTVAIVAKDCIVLAADKRATAGNFIAGKKVDKILPVAEKMALTTAGSVSDIQLLVKLIKAELSLRKLKNGRPNRVKEATNLVSGLVYNNIRRFTMIPGVVHFLFAGYDDTGVHLYDIYPDGSISEIDDFVASGSGGTFAFGVFDAQYKKDMTQEQAVELAIKAINSALQRDSASGDGLDVVLVNKHGVKKLMTKDLSVKIK